MNTKGLMKRAFVLLFVIWLWGFATLMLQLATVGGFLSGYLSLEAIQSFLTMLILGLLVYEVSGSIQFRENAKPGSTLPEEKKSS
jgi:hypothetical protein